MNRLQEASTSKRLNLVYLANEVVQQSRARSKTDFLLAFEPLIGDATALAYKNASVEIQYKIRRVIEVWRQRAIFDAKIQDALEKRLDDIDKTRGAQKGVGGSGKLGGSLFGGGSGGGVPSELEPVSKSQTALTTAESTYHQIRDAHLAFGSRISSDEDLPLRAQTHLPNPQVVAVTWGRSPKPKPGWRKSRPRRTGIR